jgi:hypothetical protein
MLAEPWNQYLYAILGFAKRILLLGRSLNLNLIKLEGRTANGEDEFLLFYLGELETLAYLKSVFFSVVTDDVQDVFPFWELRKKLNRVSLSNAVTIVEINRILGILVPKGGFQTFPWIKQKAPVDSSMFERRKGKIEDVYGRKIRQYQYSFRITKDEEAAGKFYHEFYAPYVSSKYKDIASLRSIGEIQAAVRSGFLLQVFDQDQWVSGLVCDIKGKTVRAVAAGLMPDYQYHLKRGAASACEYFLFKWAQDNSIHTIDFLRSRPNLQDGVYEFKRKWGAYSEKDAWPHTSLWIFVPDGLDIPEIVKKQLVWHKEGFVELGRMTSQHNQP